MSAPATIAVMGALMARGACARFVGGCVRDALLGRPVADIDIAVPLPPESVIALLEEAGMRAVPTGIEHGTVTAVVGRAHFEITSLRRDVETDGRHARVAFTDDWEADARRRDFTINAVFCAPDGVLYDPCGGLKDLKAGRVRFVGDPCLRIREDVLRILRFFRFHAWYGKAADAAALAACREAAPALAGLAAERVWHELGRLLLAPDPLPALMLMRENGVLPHVLPEARDLARLGALVRVEEEAGESDALRRLAAVLGAGGGDVAKEAAAVAERLKLSNAERGRLGALAAPPLALAAGSDRRAWRRALYVLGRDHFADLVFLEWAGTPAEASFAGMLALAQEWTIPALPLTGRDVLGLGVPAGKRVGELLAQVEAWWIEGDFAAGRDACLAKLKELAEKAE